MVPWPLVRIANEVAQTVRISAQRATPAPVKSRAWATCDMSADMCNDDHSGHLLDALATCERKIQPEIVDEAHALLGADILVGHTADLATIPANMEPLCHWLECASYPSDQIRIIGDRGTLNDEIALPQ